MSIAPDLQQAFRRPLAKKGLARGLAINRLKMLHDSREDHAPEGGGPAEGTFAAIASGLCASGAEACPTGAPEAAIPNDEDARS